MQKGVDYYNIEEYRITKDNILSSSISFGQSALQASQQPMLAGQQEGGLPDPKAEPVLEAAPVLDEDQVLRCVIQLFDNGEGERQRYKLKVRLNLKDGSNAEFVAPLTKDRRNFVRYIPEPGRAEIIKSADQFAKEVKKKFEVRPWLGKPHFNRGRSQSKIRNQIEPESFVGVYYNQQEHGWSGLIKIYNFAILFDLYDDMTFKQKLSGVKGQTLWVNSKYQQPRPQTWAQRTGRVK